MLVQILVDNVESWILPYAVRLKQIIEDLGPACALLHGHDQIRQGNVLVLLSCEQILKRLDLNEYNLVVHESDLPRGKGWSPLTWQILEGKNRIPITLFEAAEKVDAGVVYAQDFIELRGDELVDELRVQQGEKTIQLVADFIRQYPHVKGRPQQGESTYYPRRRPEDSRIDVHKSIGEQFDLLRVCDNDRYPAYFIRDGIKYILKIEKAK